MKYREPSASCIEYIPCYHKDTYLKSDMKIPCYCTADTVGHTGIYARGDCVRLKLGNIRAMQRSMKQESSSFRERRSQIVRELQDKKLLVITVVDKWYND